VVLKSKLVYYEATMSMSTTAVFRFMPAFTWPSSWPIDVSRQYVERYMKSNLTKDVGSHDYKFTVLC